MSVLNVSSSPPTFLGSLDVVEVVSPAVGTPPDEDGSAGLKYVLAVACQSVQHINKYTILVTKSTVPVSIANKSSLPYKDRRDVKSIHLPIRIKHNTSAILHQTSNIRHH